MDTERRGQSVRIDQWVAHQKRKILERVRQLPALMCFAGGSSRVRPLRVWSGKIWVPLSRLIAIEIQKRNVGLPIRVPDFDRVRTKTSSLLFFSHPGKAEKLYRRIEGFRFPIAATHSTPQSTRVRHRRRLLYRDS